MIAILGGLGAAACWATATVCSARSSRMIGSSSASFELELDAIPAAGGPAEPFVRGPGPAYQPDWSPDGRQLAFAGRVPGCAVADDECEQHILLVGSDGLNARPDHARSLTCRSAGVVSRRLADRVHERS